MKKWYTSVVPISPSWFMLVGLSLSRLDGFKSYQTDCFKVYPDYKRGLSETPSVWLDIISHFWIKPYPLILGRGIGVHPSVICWDLNVKTWRIFLRYQINFGTAIWLGACREGKLFLQFFRLRWFQYFPTDLRLVYFYRELPHTTEWSDLSLHKLRGDRSTQKCEGVPVLFYRLW